MKRGCEFIVVCLLVTCGLSFGRNGPVQGTFMIQGMFDYGWQFGDLVSEEGKLVETAQISAIYRDSSGDLDTLRYAYMYYTPGFEDSLACSVIDNLALGIVYNYEECSQRLNWNRNRYNYDEDAVTLLKMNKIGLSIEYAFFKTEKADFSIGLPVQMALGSLSRYPVVKRQMTMDKEPTTDTYFVLAVNSSNRQISAPGICLTPELSLRLFSRDFLYLIIGARYEFYSLIVSDSRFFEYPDALHSHKVGFHIGLGITTNPMF